MNQNILHSLYPPEQIFIVKHSFDDQNFGITVNCRIPTETQYTKNPILYVTAEQYVRCLSQASYLLAEHLLRKKLLSIDIKIDDFLEAAINWKLFYRQISMTFHELVNRNEEFKMRLTLKNVREIKRFDEFILFSFENHRSVISGALSFVYHK